MNTHEGYSKKKLSNDNVLLAGGGEKSLLDFLGGIRISSSKIQYKAANAAAAWTDLITLVNTDEYVKQVDNNNDQNSPILLKNGTGTGTITSSSIFADGVTINPKNNALSVSGYINGKILISGGAYNWYSFQQYNSSDANPTWYDLRSAIININSYSGWLPWIRGVDSEKGSWCIGQYTTNFHVAYIAKANTTNTTTKRWDFGKDGKLTSPDGFVHGGFTPPTGVSKDAYVLLAGGGYKEVSDFATSTHNHDERYVKKAGDTMTGHLYHDGEKCSIYKIERKKSEGGGWAYSPFAIRGNDNASFFYMGVLGEADALTYGYIGSGTYNSAVNLRIASTYVGTTTLIPNAANSYSVGSSANPYSNLYLGKTNGSGIYYVGTKASYRMIRFIDNTSDTYGNGIAIGGGGLTVLGSGESADTLLSSLGLTASGGSEATYIASDGAINFYPSINSWDASGLILMTASRLWAGVNGNTTREAQIGVQSGAGLILIYSNASTTGNRGMWVPAHGSGTARSVFNVDTDNTITFADAYSGTGTKLAYSKSGMSASSITWLTCWNGYELRAISKAEVANCVSSYFLTSLDHYSSGITAGTAGTSSATSGTSISIPYVTVNSHGHVTAYGTHTHTITGFLTSHLSVTNSNPNIKYGNTMTIGSVGSTNLQITLPNNEGTSDFTDSTELLTSYASNNGFADTNAPGVIYRRKAVSMYNYLVSKGFLTSHQSFSTFDNYHNTNNSYNAHQLRITIGSTTKYCTPEWLNEYEGVDYGANGLQYMNIYGPDTGRGTASTNGTPTDDWYHIIRMNHSNNGGYFVDIAACFHSWNLWYRRITNGSLEDSTVDSGWARILDSKNSSVSGGGSSWGSSITVKINGTSKTLTIPSNPNTNTWRKVQLNGTDKLGTGTGTNPLNIKAGTGMSITESSGTFTFNCTVTGSNSVAWVDVTDKIHGGNEFNMVNSGYSSTLWFNYCPVNDRSGTASVSEYIFGNGNKGKADICANTVYPSVTNTYYLGKSSYVYAGAYTRFIQSDSALSLKTNGNNTRVYINTSGNVGIGTTSPSGKLHVVGEAVVGESSYTAPQSTGSSYSGTWIGQGWLELSATDPYIDFHKSKSTLDFTSRLIHWNTQTRLKYENSDATYSGYILTCEGNHHNPVILGIFDLRRYSPGSTSWSLDNICGPCYFTLSNTWGSDVSYHDSNSYWTIPSNLLRVEINSTLGDNYTTKSTVKAAACIGTVMTRWINNHPVVANKLHGDWQGCSVECLCTNKAPGDSLYYDSQLPGKYIYITGARPWGYDDDDNGLGMDQFRQTGNLSYQRVRFVVYGWLE